MTTSIVVERRIAADRDRVWKALTDLAGLERVLSSVTKVEVLTDGPFSEGTRWRETRRMFGKEATEEMRVTACEPPERHVVEAESHGMRYISEWLLVPHGSDATIVAMTFTAVPTGGGVAKFFATVLRGLGTRAVRKAVLKDLDDLATALESGTA